MIHQDPSEAPASLPVDCSRSGPGETQSDTGSHRDRTDRIMLLTRVLPLALLLLNTHQSSFPWPRSTVSEGTDDRNYTLRPAVGLVGS